LIEQDHRNIKSTTNVMLGFNRFRSVAITISGIELMHRICKGQFDLCALWLKDTAAPPFGTLFPSINKVSIFIRSISAEPAICTRVHRGSSVLKRSIPLASGAGPDDRVTSACCARSAGVLEVSLEIESPSTRVIEGLQHDCLTAPGVRWQPGKGERERVPMSFRL
jgi:hypothetical protein